MIITIDGPSGSGKTTLAILIAQELHFFCLNTGYLYRGLSYILKNYYGYDQYKIRNPDIVDVQAIFDSGNFRYEYQYGLTKIYWGLDDITQFLKCPEISILASLVACCDAIRLMVHDYELLILNNKDAVIEGRACGSVLYQNAEVKFYLDASLQIRAQRLQKDQLKKGISLTNQEALKYVKMRDDIDKNRQFEPLVIPHGAIILDSTDDQSDVLLKQALFVIREKIKNI